jgi:hypothetical protein
MGPVSQALLVLDNQLYPDRDTITAEARIAEAFDIVQRGHPFDHLANHARLKIARVEINDAH